MSTPVLNVRAAGVTVAATGVISALIWKFGDLLELLFTKELAADIVNKTVFVVVVLLIGVVAIMLGWAITGAFRDLWLDPIIDPETKKKKKWDHEARRLKRCSFVWTFVVAFVGLSLRFRYSSTDIIVALEQLFYNLIGSVIFARASVPLYDVVVKRGWPAFLRYLFPTKLVQTPDGIEERDVTVPSAPDEKTMVVRKPPPKE